ncbi:hypothetical protein PHYBOEH_010808 [Phytophthora boehmeriae]|uniref:Uncharacterized protein n=1 Tax=Phytophthora boehmeriae TaxID=109152 RepID=A0A8T1VKG8_9STRA|nr:hypothetical protein PHYBOEH_010808 [Phytophthora boehmeriae]
MQTNTMQSCAQISFLEQHEAFEEPEREDVDMEVELGVNLVDTFAKKRQSQAAMVHSPMFDEPNCQFGIGVDLCALPPQDDRDIRNKQKMVEFLYAFEKFQIVYDDSYDT